MENDIYKLVDKTDPDNFNKLILKKDIEKKLEKLYTYINKSESITTYTANNLHYLYVNKDLIKKGIEEFIVNDNKALSLLQVDKNFFDVFDIKLGNNQLIEATNFFNKAFESNLTPVLMGSDFKDSFSLNQIFEDNHNNSYIVKGFINESSFYIDPIVSKEISYLNKTIIMPKIIKDDMDFSELDSLIFSTFFLTNDVSYINNIKEMSSELGIYSLDYKSFSQQLKVVVKSTMEEVKYTLFILIIILIFAIIGMISNLIQFISNNKTEFAIKLLCGSNIYFIIFRIAIQVYLLILPALLIVIVIYGFSSVTLVTMCISFFIGLISLAIPIITLLKSSIIYTIRGA